MESQELGAIVILAGYGALLLAAIRAFGVRRVAWALALVVFLAVVVAFRTFLAVTGSRRY